MEPYDHTDAFDDVAGLVLTSEIDRLAELVIHLSDAADQVARIAVVDAIDRAEPGQDKLHTIAAALVSIAHDSADHRLPVEV